MHAFGGVVLRGEAFDAQAVSAGITRLVRAAYRRPRASFCEPYLLLTEPRVERFPSGGCDRWDDCGAFCGEP
jgi:hypothetical protein